MLDSSVLPPSNFNPHAGNPFRTRDHVVAACRALFDPLLPHFSPGAARVQLDATTSTWDRAACDLEGWARPLFGIIPMVLGGAPFPHWELYRRGLRNGTDPEHPEYWGQVVHMDQRHVEATAIGYALMAVPQHIFEPLDQVAKKNVIEWLLTSRGGKHAANNHMFFRVFVDLGLKNVGVEVDESMTEEYLSKLENLYIQDGWYRDGADKGDDRRIDYYNAFAMHYYGLLYAKYCPGDTRRNQLFRTRARKFAHHFQHWFADTGSNVPYGRSLVYRHCVVAFWGALAFLDEEALPWGVIKGIYLRNLRWWSTQPITRSRDGLLSVGYAYPNQLISERYSAAGSPWWAMKAFVALAVPENHPFWTSEETSVERQSPYPSAVSGMTFIHSPGHTVMLASGPETGQQMRGTPEKYSKFAYSSHFGFSVESDQYGFQTGAFDSMIAFSDDGKHYRVREHCDVVKIDGDRLYSVWHPWPDVTVETWIVPAGKWHLRVHLILSPRSLDTVEGGFAASRTDFYADEQHAESQAAYVVSKLGHFSGIVDLSEPARRARVIAPHGNTSVSFPRTLIPQLAGEVKAGIKTIFTAAIMADPASERGLRAWYSPPKAISVEQLQGDFEQRGVTVEVTM